MSALGKRTHATAISLMLGIIVAPSWAQTCEALQASIGESTQLLEKASSENDLEAATGAAQSASDELDYAAMAALDCGCKSASDELDSASTGAREAADSDSEDFQDALNQSIRSFNSGLEFLRACAEGGAIVSTKPAQNASRR